MVNGDVWTPRDCEEIRQISGCDDVMIGRGVIIRPDLIRRIKTGEDALAWNALLPCVADYYDQLCARMKVRHAPGRLKQWLGMMRVAYPEAQMLYQLLRVERDPMIIKEMLNASRI